MQSAYLKSVKDASGSSVKCKGQISYTLNNASDNIIK